MEKSINQVKKLDRKQRRIQQKINAEININCSNQPSRNIVVCNAGLVNGLTEELVFKIFSNHGVIERIIMLPGKSYCCIIFESIDDARKAYENIHGNEKSGQYNNPLVLSFFHSVTSLPSSFDEDCLPPGLIIYENFISEDEEAMLMNLIVWDESSDNQNVLKHRQVKHFGYEFRYDINNVDCDKPLEQKIPPECNFIYSRLLDKGYEKQLVPDQLTVNKYQPGQGIPSHIDTHSAFQDPILSLSLASDIVMEFKNKNTHVSVNLPRRSLLVMSKEARYAWTHGIVPRIFDTVSTEKGLTVRTRGTRISFTFRKVLTGECNCTYSEYCDSALKNNSVTRKIEDDIAEKLELTHVHKVYDEIATHFSDTRHKPWPNVVEFIQSLSLGSIMLDIGCGNGKYLGEKKTIYNIGCDRNVKLLEVCAGRNYQVAVSDCLKLPFRNNCIDGCISIAVIHHLASEERRLQALKEMTRVLRIGGKCLIYVWAKDQSKDKIKSNYLKQDRKNRKEDTTSDKTDIIENNCVFENDIKLPVHVNRTQFQHQDVMVPWKLKTNSDSTDNKNPLTFLRFYHVFEENELENLCSKITNIKIIKNYYDQGNWCVIFKKI